MENLPQNLANWPVEFRKFAVENWSITTRSRYISVTTFTPASRLHTLDVHLLLVRSEIRICQKWPNGKPIQIKCPLYQYSTRCTFMSETTSLFATFMYPQCADNKKSTAH